MCSLLLFLLEEPPPGPPLVGNNLVFYTVVGCILLSLLVPLVLWLRRRHDKTEPRP